MYKLIPILLLLCWAPMASCELQVDKQAQTTQQAQTDKQVKQKGKSRFWPSWEKVTRMFKQATEPAKERDPWESWNRKVFAFNDRIDRWVLSPVARGYQWVTPDPLEKGIGNVFSNLFEINVVVNDLLQFKLTQAAADSGRFLVNTTMGVGGLFDVATSMGLEKHQEDFGQTLGRWGVSSGPYLVLPVLGSFTMRSAVGSFADSSIDVTRSISHIPTRNQVWTLRLVDKRAQLFAAESLITGDRYTFIRDAFLQRRDFLVNDGSVEDDFGDEDFDDWNEE